MSIGNFLPREAALEIIHAAQDLANVPLPDNQHYNEV
jgi:hypothetical protein